VLAKNKQAVPNHATCPEPTVIPLNTAQMTLNPLELIKLAVPAEASCGPLKVMPDLKGMTMRRAMKVLTKSGVHCRVKGTGLAVSQDPPPGTPLEPETFCVVQFEPHS
jgi:hypothetical protein